MALRLLEVTLPYRELDGVTGLLEGVRTVQVWTSGVPDGPGQARVLLDAHDAESLSDALVKRFGTRDDFRIVLLPVEATLPAVEEPLAEAADAAAREEPPVGSRISREELHEDLREASRTTRVFVVMVVLSTVVAAVGLLRGDVAIIIGAMVIAPLLGPNVALSLGCTLGDLALVRRSLRATGTGVVTAGALSVLIGLVAEVDPGAAEIASRTQAGATDVVLALAAGAAGSLAFTSGVPAVVVGVMVAVALLPPIVTAGLLTGAGHGGAAVGALVLALVNTTCINLAAIATFLVQKVGPRSFWESHRATKATRRAVTIWVLLLAVLAAIMVLQREGVV